RGEGVADVRPGRVAGRPVPARLAARPAANRADPQRPVPGFRPRLWAAADLVRSGVSGHGGSGVERTPRTRRAGRRRSGLIRPGAPLADGSLGLGTGVRDHRVAEGEGAVGPPRTRP